jgi:hypothetical protein
MKFEPAGVRHDIPAEEIIDFSLVETVAEVNPTGIVLRTFTGLEFASLISHRGDTTSLYVGSLGRRRGYCTLVLAKRTFVFKDPQP